MNNKAVLVAILIIIFSISYFFGIAPPSSSQTSPQKHTPSATIDKITVGYIPITDAAQVIVAKNMNIFEKHGLDVELIPLRGGALILQALSSGDVDVAFSNLASVVYYQENVDRLKTLAGGTLMNESFSEAGLVIRSTDEDLMDNKFDNRIIAVNTRGNIVELALLKYLSDSGTNINSVSFVELPFKDMEVALRSNKVDAIPLPEPLLTKALNTGGLYDLGDYFVLAYKELYGTGYFTTNSKFDNSKELFVKFNSAINEVTPIVNSFNEDVIGAISKTTKVPENLLSTAGRAKFIETLPENAISDMKSKMQSAGWLDIK